VLGTYSVETPAFLFIKSKFKLIITTENLLFTDGEDKKKIRRKVPIEMLSGISKKIKAGSRSLVFHIYKEADEFVRTDDRDEILDLVKRMYAYKVRKNLLIFAPAEKSLGDY
jgi:hypothetical protein